MAEPGKPGRPKGALKLSLLPPEEQARVRAERRLKKSIRYQERYQRRKARPGWDEKQRAYRQRKKERQMGIAKLNDQVLKALVKDVGVHVRYWPIWKAEAQTQFLDTITESEPWMLGHGEWVVSVRGRSGGVSVSHMALLATAILSPDEAEPQGPAYGRG